MQSRFPLDRHILSNPVLFLDSCLLQVDVDWEKIQAKIEMELSKEREKAASASARSGLASRR